MNFTNMLTSALLNPAELVQDLAENLAALSFWLLKVVVSSLLLLKLTKKAEEYVLKGCVRIEELSLYTVSIGSPQDLLAESSCKICWDTFTSDDTVLTHSTCGNAVHKTCVSSWLEQPAIDKRLCVACRTPLDDVRTMPKVCGMRWRIDVLETITRRLFWVTFGMWLFLSPALIAYNRFVLYGLASPSILAHLLRRITYQFAAWTLASALIETLKQIVRAGSRQRFHILGIMAYAVIYFSLVASARYRPIGATRSTLLRTVSRPNTGMMAVSQIIIHVAIAIAKAVKLLHAAEVLPQFR